MSVKKSKYRGTGLFVEVLRNDPCALCGNYYMRKRGAHKRPDGTRRPKMTWSTVDHIHPKSQGGLNAWHNYCAACPNCNTKKADNSLLGHLLGAQIPSRHKPIPYNLPWNWFDPLGVLLDGQYSSVILEL